MSRRVAHLPERHLFERYMAEREGRVLDSRATAHLATCSRCALQYDELVRLMESAREVALADAVFTPERLRVQQLQIGRRLKQAEHAARVLAFPARASAQPRPAAAPGVRRWIAGAAAAGLFAAAAAGALSLSQSRALRLRGPHAPARQVHLTPVRASIPASSPENSALDDAFLSELELAVGSPRTPELQPFDALTPRVVEVASKEQSPWPR